MQDDSEYIELRSEEVQEILGTPPAWLVQTGSLLMLLIIGIMVLVAALVRYPDVVSERIHFTPASPPHEVLASRSGVLERILVADGGTVEAGAPLAVWRSSARYADVLFVAQCLRDWRALPMDSLALVSWPSGLVLGEIMPAYSAFLADVNAPEDASTADRMDLQAHIIQAFDRLGAALYDWERQHIVSSPISGKVVVNPDAMGNALLEEGLLLLTIMPPGSDALTGTMTLPIAGSGKIAVGQRVVVRLEHFPHQEFGVLEGVVHHVALSARDNACKVQVQLTHGLNTSFGVTLPDQSALIGRADIITDNRSFLQRVADQVFTARQKPSFRNS